MTSYGDVWAACEEAFGRGTRFDLEVCGTRHRADRDGTRVTMEWTLTYWSAVDRRDCQQFETATADEMIARIKTLGATTAPGDVGAIHPGLAASIASVTGEDNATKEENRS